MSAPFAKDIHSSLVEATLGALWVQWRSIGGMTSARQRARSTVDPEALVLCSLALGDHERRLEEVVLDWTALNSHLLSIQRMKNLARAFPSPVLPRLGTLAGRMLREGKDARWKSLAAHEASAPSRPARAPRPVRLAAAPDYRDPAAIMLRLRLGLGIGNKADVLTFLLGNSGSPATVRALTIGTGYTVHALHRTVDDMARAGFIHATDDSPATYRVQAEDWREVLGSKSFARWCHWVEFYAFTAEFDYWMHEIRGRTVSEYAFGVHARDLVKRHRAVFVRAGVRLTKAAGPLRDDSEPTKHFVAATRQLVSWISANV